jgi:uncharacterized membrane protein
MGISLGLGDTLALILFALAWVAYEPALKALSRGRTLINTDMVTIRTAWMRAMVGRDQRLLDSQLVGHALNSASFFASSNLILIAAAAGILGGGDAAWRSIRAAPFVAEASRVLFDLKLAVIAITLARSLLAFIWAIRQLNYCLAIIGAAPTSELAEKRAAYGEAAADVLTAGLSSFNSGVRGYYFALAAAAWLLGPWAFATATLGGVVLLAWRQAASPAAKALRRVRLLLEADEA